MTDKLKDEKIQMPTFDGEEAKWLEYKLKFKMYARLTGMSDVLIGTEKDNTKVEYFTYKLLMSVKGEALDVVREFTNELETAKTCSEIWEKFVSHYEKQESRPLSLYLLSSCSVQNTSECEKTQDV